MGTSRLAMRIAVVDLASGARTAIRGIPVSAVDAGGILVQTISVPVDGLEPGRYILYFYAEAEGTEARGHASVPLTIR